MDATDIADHRWIGIYRQKPAVVLRCRGCAGGLGARVSKNGLRHFFHRRENPDCPSAGETEEHRRLKQIVAETVRGLGGVATIEAMPGPTDAGAWRADVLAEREGRRIAFEIQHSPMQVDIGKHRSERYRRDRIAVCWVTAHDANWIWRVPSARLRENEDGWLVTRGTVMTRREPHGRRLRWEPTPPIALGVFIERLLEDDAVVVVQDSLMLERWHTVTGAERNSEQWGWVAWASRRHTALMRQQEEFLESERLAAEAERAYRRSMSGGRFDVKSFAKWDGMWSAAVDYATDVAGSGGGLVVGRAQHAVEQVHGDRLTRIAMMIGERRDADAPTISVKQANGSARLIAVVSPPVRHITPAVARRWASSRVIVLAADEADAIALRQRLGRQVRVEALKETRPRRSEAHLPETAPKSPGENP